mmetsp:Transcript_24247/g.24865  ORF Transcript_24247/g.24865 Transcript_24247/m.24865 type:complete len:175 (+) Transcript_24247:42-566(+)|eukprot:CAMPEP_0174824422 /NCGR_PEP_ID=MMETSP1107-20130205/34092_1 /TAXON_ID=36770 /ORGANISM="Paraphysomonas vestita, Strain GFlagA" /LENGTH=174 /DNA_ID=CAMNT_0016051645 /DNA_START=33 /DNA_END=557 /DNA_ORIENTATION=+
MNRQNNNNKPKTLSEKFSKIAERNLAGTTRQARKIVVVRDQSKKRQVQANAKRGIVASNRPTNSAGKRNDKVSGRKQSGRGNGRGIRGGRGGAGRGSGGRGAKGKTGPKKNNNNNNNSAPKSQSELDLEMDSYWFAAGKGPNPVAAALDQDMDNYFKDRVPKPESTEATTTTTS